MSNTPLIGNQRYDAVVRDMKGNTIDLVELTFPDDWEAEAKDAKLLFNEDTETSMYLNQAKILIGSLNSFSTFV